jgi:hypothetical protein
MARRDEWLIQIEVARLFGTWLPADCFYSAVDATSTSPKTGKMRRLRGLKAGLPDTWVVYRGKLITIELKSRQGKCTPSQRAVRLALLRAGADWWEARSPNGAMRVLERAKIKFRTLVHNDGTTERWRRPKLAPWEEPRREPRPSAGRDCAATSGAAAVAGPSARRQGREVGSGARRCRWR